MTKAININMINTGNSTNIQLSVSYPRLHISCKIHVHTAIYMTFMPNIAAMELTLHLYMPTQYEEGSGLSMVWSNIMATAEAEMTK
jgi:hypothetical protein